MLYRPLGSTGLSVSELGFGCGNVGGLMVRGSAAEQREVIARALDAGVTYFDTAPSYGNGQSEENLGRALADLNAWHRITVGTKLTLTTAQLGDAAAAVRDSLRASLRRLGRDSVDLVQLHSRIVATEEAGDRALPADEVSGAVADAMRQAVREGLTRYTGITGLGGTQAVKSVVASSFFDTVQCYFNALNPSAGYPGASAGAQDFGGLINDASHRGLGVIAIRVMAAGAITGSAERAKNASPAGGGALTAGGAFDADLRRASRLASLARELGLEGTHELGFRFALAKRGVSTVLVGLSDLPQFEDALRWVERGPLDESVVSRIVEAAKSA
jgi:aryl-alcohol dehydrogenase-like predicted oxidoreductase